MPAKQPANEAGQVLAFSVHMGASLSVGSTQEIQPSGRIKLCLPGGNEPMTADNSEEKRMHARVRFLDPVRANPVLHAQHSWYLLAQDLSEGGIQLLSPELFAVSTRLLLDIEHDAVSEPLRCVGRVAWTAQSGHQEHVNIGVEFVEVDEIARARLRHLIAAQFPVYRR